MRRRASNEPATTRPAHCTTTTWRGSRWRNRWERCAPWCSSGERLMKKRAILVVIVLAVAAVAVYAFRGSGRTPSNRIVVSGNIELNEVNIAFKTAGRLIERNVDEGDRVT